MRMGWLLGIGLTLALMGCGANSDDANAYGENAGSGGSTQDSGTPSDGSTAGTGGSFDANVPLDGSGDFDTHPPQDGDTCSAQSHEAEPYPLDMYVLMDQSGSMTSEIGLSGKTKWEAAVEAFTSFLNNTPQQGLSMGIQFFPLPITPWSQMATCDPNAPDCGNDTCVTVDTGSFCHGGCTTNADCSTGSECRGGSPGFCSNDSCDGNAYATPEVEIGALPGVNASLITALQAHGPTTMTPTGPAIGGALVHAREWANANPEHTVIVILATDGMPTVCPAADSEAQLVNTVKGIAADGVNGTPSIKTFVIGVEMAANFMAINNLNAIAASGGTTKAFVVNPNQDMTAQFAAALEAIRGAAMECEFKIPVTSALDYGEVNVVYTAVNGTEHTVYYVNDPSQCDPVNGGWFYDTDPAQTPPTKIILCPQSCDFMQQYGGKIDIEIGCKTITAPK